MLELNAVGGAVMTKLGEGHPPLGVALARSGWCICFVAITTLLKTKLMFYRKEAQEPSDEGR